MSKISGFLRSIILAALVIAAAFICGIRLLQIQIADGGKYLSMTKATYVAEQTIEAARGKVADCEGTILNTNKLCYSVNLQRASLIRGTENEIIYRVLTVLEKNGEEWNDTLPISRTKPYKFESGRDSAIDALKSSYKLGVYATEQNCMDALYDKYEISEEYTEEMRRAIAGVRYEMTLRDFSNQNRFVLANSISTDTMTELKELSVMLAGVDITEGWERVYLDGTIAPHLRGTVGLISADKYAELKDSGYLMSDIVGTSGIESAMESVLRGERGVRSITRSSSGIALKDEVTKSPQAGNSVMLTIDSDFQRMVQEIVQYHIDFLHSPNYTTLHDAQHRGTECYSGAAVVLDVKTGGVMAMVSNPGYDLNDLVSNYSEVLNADYSPIFNRAISGVYRPGSTFKTITATAGLAEGVITPQTHIYCGTVYNYYSDYKPKCTGFHQSITVEYGLKYSCNIFFYETARLLGINRLSSWAARFGIGTDLGFELGGETGRMTSLEAYEALGKEWNEGDIVQAGIGQCETYVTPLNLAVQAMTIANRGIRYRPYIVKSVYNYDYTELLYETQPEVVEDMSEYHDVFDTVTEGMKLVSQNAAFLMGPDYSYPFMNIYEYKGIDVSQVATKTGTPEYAAKKYNSAVIGFYPADEPEIAFGIYMEKAEFSRHIAANIISAYVTGEFNPTYDENGDPLIGL